MRYIFKQAAKQWSLAKLDGQLPVRSCKRQDMDPITYVIV